MRTKERMQTINADGILIKRALEYQMRPSKVAAFLEAGHTVDDIYSFYVWHDDDNNDDDGMAVYYLLCVYKIHNKILAFIIDKKGERNCPHRVCEIGKSEQEWKRNK